MIWNNRGVLFQQRSVCLDDKKDDADDEDSLNILMWLLCDQQQNLDHKNTSQRESDTQKINKAKKNNEMVLSKEHRVPKDG